MADRADIADMADRAVWADTAYRADRAGKSEIMNHPLTGSQHQLLEDAIASKNRVGISITIVPFYNHVTFFIESFHFLSQQNELYRRNGKLSREM